MAFPNITDIVATTLEERSGEFADNITDNIPLLTRLSQKGNIEEFDGGRLIYEELAFAENTNGAWYSGYDTLGTSAQDLLSAAEFSVKQYSVAVTVSGLELIQNSGRNKVISLLKSRIEASRSKMKNDIDIALHNDGTGAYAKAIVGLNAMVPIDPTTGTYGAIDRASYTFWRSQLNDIQITGGNDLEEMTELWAKCTRGNDVPDLILAGQTRWIGLLDALQANQRFTDPKMADAGFVNVMFMSAPVVLTGGIGGNGDADDFFFLNTKYIKWRPVAGRNMVALKERNAFNQDASVTHLVWAGALTCNGAQFQGRLTGD